MGVRGDGWTGTRQDKVGGEFASRGLKSSCTHGCSWGESSLGSCSAWGSGPHRRGSIPTQLLTKPRALAPCLVWH